MGGAGEVHELNTDTQGSVKNGRLWLRGFQNVVQIRDTIDLGVAKDDRGCDRAAADDGGDRNVFDHRTAVFILQEIDECLH